MASDKQWYLRFDFLLRLGGKVSNMQGSSHVMKPKDNQTYPIADGGGSTSQGPTGGRSMRSSCKSLPCFGEGPRSALLGVLAHLEVRTMGVPNLLMLC